MAPHDGSSGQPYLASNDLGPFAPTGDPEKVQTIGGASTEGAAPDEGDAALAKLGASIRKKTRSSSLSKGMERVSIPTEPEGITKSPYNRKG